MKPLKRSLIVAVALAGIMAGASPASAIIGGHDATQTYPGMAAESILFPGLGVAACGATLVSPRFVLTAAHCVSDPFAAPTPVAMPGGNVTVRIGSTDRTAGGTVVTGKRVYLHPVWQWGANWPNGPVADLAVVELSRDVWTPVMPLYPRTGADNDQLRLIGWGVTAPENTHIPAILQERDVTRLPSAQCADGFIGTGDICVSAGACFGDSGSPALRRVGRSTVPGTPRWASVGIASRETSDTCAGPTVYTDPTHPPFRDWLLYTISTRQIMPCTCPPSPDTATSSRPTFRWKITSTPSTQHGVA